MREVKWNRKWQLLSLVLAIALVISISFNVYQRFGCSSESDRDLVFDRAFVFKWPSSQQNITKGTLRIEALFNWEGGENLNITVTVNDDEYIKYNDYLGIVFDRNKNGEIDLGFEDLPYAFFGNNVSYYWKPAILLLETGRCCYADVEPRPSPYHICIFNNETGYKFEISIPKEEVNFHLPMPVHLCFYDIDFAHGYMFDWVWVRFEVR